jgi:DNA-binding MarR family transcriptional regulator
VEALLLVAKHPGLSQVQIAEKLGTTTATASRTLANTLMIRFGLIRQAEDTANRTVKRIHLTAKGERFMDELLGYLNNE